MRNAIILTAVSAVLSIVLASAAAARTTPTGFGSPACLRGHWVAGQGETARVMRALAPVPGMTVNSRLYMQFRGGLFQYGTTSMILRTEIGDAVLTAKARFFTLAPYTARRGLLTLSGGETTIEYDEFTGTKNGRTYSVPGPPTTTSRSPAGSTPFQCRGTVLKVRLPRFASLNWITLQRG
jgi:hypothetical protein